MKWAFLPLLLLPLYGYLDPGSGSILLAILFTATSLVYFTLRRLLQQGKDLLFRVVHRGHRESTAPCQLLIYSEGSAYWPLFQPLLLALEKRDSLRCQYWSSDPQDPGLHTAAAHIHTQYIGTGSKAFFRLNQAQADLCLLTTPGLDVLQIRRSRGVRHYCHLIHSPQDVASYQLFSFDFFDSVLVSGPHQIASLRMLETKRGTQKKHLLPTGLCYFDTLLTRLHEQSASAVCPARRHILVAPSWRENSLLHHGGAKLIRALLQAGFSVTLRPHPQSWQQEQSLLDRVCAELGPQKHFDIDRSSDNFQALHRADLLLSDFSGIVFDFLFVFEKPVFTLVTEDVWPGYEWIDFDQPPWEIEVMNQLGLRISFEQLDQLPQRLAHAHADPQWRERVRQLRLQSVYHFGQAGEAAARHLLSLHRQQESI